MAEWEIVPLLDAEGSFCTYAKAFPGLADAVFAPGDHDRAHAARTRAATLERLAADGTRVASPHLPGTFGHVERTGEGFAWHPSK